ncbi:MAG: LPS-assembly protein LptD [Deltaproteobacteria bacterium]|nr:LPS-assembly protein LptD [Deltaproteobacteria bacterium]
MAIFFLTVFSSHDSSAGDLFSKDRFLDQDEPWNITAKSMSFRDKEKIYDAEGDVVISSGDQSLYAQKASYNMLTGIVQVSGDVRLESGGDIFAGESGEFDLNKQTGRITKGSLFLKDNNFYIKGDLMEKLDEDSYLVKDCHVTTCDGEKPVWSITGSEVEVTIEGYGTVKHAKLRIRDVPVLYFPYMMFPAKTKRQSGLLPPTFGHSSRNGTELEIPFFWAISDQTDATFYQRYMSRRGYMQGLEFRYVSDKESKGTFLFDILSDQEDKDMTDPDDIAISPYPRTNDTRYWFRGRMDQNLPNGIVARLDADYVSDQDYLLEFASGNFDTGARPNLVDESGRPVEERRSPIRTSALRVSRDTDEYSLQAGTSYHQLPGNPGEDRTAQPLGSLSFSLLPESILKSPVFFDIESGYEYVWRDEGLKGHSFTLSPTLRAPLRFARYLEFEPSIRYTLTPQRFGLSQGDKESHVLNSYEVGAKISTSLDRD